MLISINNFLSKEEIKSFLNKETSIESIVGKASKTISGIVSYTVNPMWAEFLTMKPGSLNSKHTDVDNETENLVAAIVYLNNEYFGGKFIFENVTIKPNTGQLLFFNSNKSTPHSVTEVIGGDRLSISMFFNNDNNGTACKYLSKTISNKYKRDNRPI